jgi:hypothetical protein
MVIRLLRFNLKLLLLVSLLGLLALTGCLSPEAKQERQKATLRVHLEANPNPPGQTERIIVLRSAPTVMHIEKQPCLTEVHIAAAQLLDVTDGFLIMIKLNQQGQWLLEQYTTSNPNRRFAIRTQFRQSTNVFDRWIAAPLIGRPVRDGLLAFTPDADREEARLIVRGWNNVAGYESKEDDFNAKFSKAP